MATEKFCLKWNDFENNISVAFRDLRNEKDFFDITLACEDSQIQAHKVILSACSPFFRNVLRNNPHAHPLIYLRGMKYSDLESVLNFMYHGEVNVAQEELNSFLSVAEDLKVKGLTQNQNGEPTNNKRSSSPTPSKSKPPDRDPGPPPKRSRPAPVVIEEDDIQEVIPVKSEPKELVPSASVPAAASDTDYHSQAIVQHEDYVEENYEEYDQYEDQYLDQPGQPDTEKGREQIIMGDADDLNDLAKLHSEQTGVGQVRCTLCGKLSSHSGNARQHFEAHHFASNQAPVCPICIKPFRTKHSLSSHMSKNHRGNRQPTIQSE